MWNFLKDQYQKREKVENIEEDILDFGVYFFGFLDEVREKNMTKVVWVKNLMIS